MKTSKTMMTPLSHHDSQLFPWLRQRENSTFVARGCLPLVELAPGVCHESEECCVIELRMYHASRVCLELRESPKG